MYPPKGAATENATGRSSSEEKSDTETLEAENSEGEREEAALSRLFRRSARYRDVEEYKRFLDFVGRFPQYSPYNAALLHVQDPGVSFTATRRQGCLYRVLLNNSLGIEEQYGALAHELGHLFCGHLGAGSGAWWDGCAGADKPPQEEIEAESVAYLACRRAGLHSLSERYLYWYVERAGGSSEGLLPPVRLRAVLEAAGYVESMGEKGFQSKRGEDT